MDLNTAITVLQEQQPGPPLSPYEDALALPTVDDADFVPPQLTVTTETNPLESLEPDSGTGSKIFAEQVARDQHLVDRIISHYSSILEDTERNSRLRDISSLSKILFESCSDHIWREMNSLSPFLWLLPQSELHASGMVSCK